MFAFLGLRGSYLRTFDQGFKHLVAEWIHFTLFAIILPTIKLEVYTFGGL